MAIVIGGWHEVDFFRISGEAWAQNLTEQILGLEGKLNPNFVLSKFGWDGVCPPLRIDTVRAIPT